MIARTARLGHRFRSLRTRLVLVLSLAILPLGFLAVQQTRSVLEDARALEEQDILLRTGRAAGAEQALFRRAHGAAQALGAAAVRLQDDDATCDAMMADFVASAPVYTFAGFANAQGQLRCTSGGQMDLGAQQAWLDFIERPEADISLNLDGPFSGESVVVVTMPIFDPRTDALLGATYVSLPHSLTDTLLSAQIEGVNLMLLNAQGTILSASTGIASAARYESLDIIPAEFGLSAQGTTFTLDIPRDGERLAALVPLIADRIYVLGLWDEAMIDQNSALLGPAAPAFPILIWIVALIVAVLAIDRMVLRHLTELRRRMASFSIDDPSDSFAILDRPPAEIGQIAGTYNRMVDRILADRTDLEDSLHEKELLLREVHHRVKNNLQLIASILNMQLRSVPDGDAHRVLKRVQARVMSLATIHKALYTGTQMATVRADRLLEEVVQAAFNVGVPPGAGVRTSFRADDIRLDPDQAVPLALLANETVTNATKYLGRPETGAPRIDVRLFRTEGHCVHLVIENSLGPRLQDDEGGDGTGLGARLIEGFVAQLGGDLDVSEEGGLYRVEISFVKFTEALEKDADGGAETEGKRQDHEDRRALSA